MKPARRNFMAGLFCGAITIATVWVGSIWWQSRVQRSLEDAALYDACLARGSSTVACGAFMRNFDRVRAKETAREKVLNEGGARMLAEGKSKREVVDWATRMGGVGRQISDAAGISLEELQSGKY